MYWIEPNSGGEVLVCRLILQKSYPPDEDPDVTNGAESCEHEREGLP